MSLTDREARDAARYNRRSAASVGWKAQYPRIAVLLGLDRMSVDAATFARAIHDWQASQKPPLTKDGKIGPNTWSRLRTVLDQEVRMTVNVPLPAWLSDGGSASSSSPTIIAPAPATGGGPRWFQIARAEELRWRQEINRWTADKNRRNAEAELEWDEAYFAASPYWGARTHEPGEVPSVKNMDWCAAFANYCLHRAGFSHTGSAGANSFLKSRLWQFNALTEPAQGCVIVVGNPDTGKGAHVAFLDSWSNLPSSPNGHVEHKSDRIFHLLGGNQNQKVCSQRDGKSRNRSMLAAKGQNGVTSPYLWPLQGGPTCNIGSVIATERPHHCGRPAAADD